MIKHIAVLVSACPGCGGPHIRWAVSSHLRCPDCRAAGRPIRWVAP